MSIREIKNRFRDKVWIFLKAKWKLRSGLLIRIENDSDWFVFNELFTNKEYDAAFNSLSASTSSTPLILDLGANVGYFTLRVAEELIMSGYNDFEIVALEASSANFRILRRRLDQPILRNKVKSFYGLAGYRSGEGKVVHSALHFGYSSVGASLGMRADSVNYVNIEELISDATRRIALLKCDIEGSEEIFISAYPDLLNRVDAAVFEFHATVCDVENCRNLLKHAGLVSRGVFKEDTEYKTTVEIFSRR